MDAERRKQAVGPSGSSGRSLPGLLGLVAGRLALGAVYWAVVTPIALVLRASRRTPLDVHFRAVESSYWIVKEPSEQTLKRYEKPY